LPPSAGPPAYPRTGQLCLTLLLVPALPFQPAGNRLRQYDRSMTETGASNSVTLRFLAAPTDVGHSGSVDAGTVLEWVDKAAYAAAVGWAKSYCVTAYV
jgi:hypothetical protein